jgi:hypothetical protein
MLQSFETISILSRGSPTLRLWLLSYQKHSDCVIRSDGIRRNCIVTWHSVTIDWFWIDDRFYWTLWYSSWLHFTIHYYTHTYTRTSVHSHIFISRCSVAASKNKLSNDKLRQTLFTFKRYYGWAKWTFHKVHGRCGPACVIPCVGKFTEAKILSKYVRFSHRRMNVGHTYVLWRIEELLGKGREISNYTTAVAK